jgi:hypothetical protein
LADRPYGVGKSPDDKHPVPDMRGTNGGSRYAIPPHAIPERGQVSQNLSEEVSPNITR